MLISFIRTLILYIFVIIALRIMGKRQIGELQPSEFVVAIMISELAAIPMQATGVPLINGIVPIVTLMCTEVAISYLSMKNKRARDIISGKPSILIRDGKIDIDEMRRLRFNIDDLLEELRINKCPNVSDVEIAILETNGKLSVFPKGEKQNVTLSDMGIAPKGRSIFSVVISDGRLDRKALIRSGHDEQWLKDRLKQYNIYSYDKVFLASVDDSGNLSIQIDERRK